MENIPWLYNTGAQATYLSEKLFRKIPKDSRPPKNCLPIENSLEEEVNY
jgi:hypothetical protein